MYTDVKTSEQYSNFWYNNLKIIVLYNIIYNIYVKITKTK